jgi:hypothetical protein
MRKADHVRRLRKWKNYSDLCLRLAALLIFGCLFASAVFGQTNNRDRPRAKRVKEQISFSSEGNILNRVKLPKDILEQLSDYDNGQLKECQNGNWRKADINDHFAASKININGDKQQDLIVQAQTTCFMGAHNTTFWIFARVGQRLSPGYELVFDLRADFLSILKTSTNGYRDIETASHTAVELYTTKWKFDGQKYQPASA